MNSPTVQSFGWPAIVRLGLVQAALGAIVVLTTSTLNRIMAVELALPALLPGLLVGLHHGVQLTRPRMGWGSDVGGRRTPWIAGGMSVLAVGGALAALGTAWMGTRFVPGLVLTAVAFLLVGLGVSAAGTSLLALLAKRVPPARRSGAAATVWIMMIAGFAITAGLAGRWLDPYSPDRLVAVSASVSLLAWLLALAALAGLEGHPTAFSRPAPEPGSDHGRGMAGAASFQAALRDVWADREARMFTVFVFVSMLAYSAQDLVLEPFAAVAFGFSPGQTTRLSGIQHGGALTGMLLAALAGRRLFGLWFGSLRTWTVAGCLASGGALAGLVMAGMVAREAPPGQATWPLVANVFLLGACNGAFSIAAIGSMMGLAGSAGDAREGVRMGLWGASQAIAFAVGGVGGTVVADLARWLLSDAISGYTVVFAAESALFVAAALLAARVGALSRARSPAMGRERAPALNPG